MITVKRVKIDGIEAEGVAIKTDNDQILVIRAKNGVIGCGYINAELANQLDDAVAIVRGVKSFDDILKANVVKASKKAEELGVKEGMLGEDAIALMS